jgi:hypothetical protein
MSSSLVVVEIDTRKGPARTVFESSSENQTEQAKQFWKTISLAPHIESSLYSKEISQLIKPNSLKEISIDNSRKPFSKDPSKQYLKLKYFYKKILVLKCFFYYKETESFLKYVQILNQSDEIMKIEKRLSKIDQIRQLRRFKRNKSLEVLIFMCLIYYFLKIST